MKIHEELSVKIADAYDVAVCGGGIAGISAALAAARQGKKTVLFERSYMLGGLGTAGLITIYLPLCDGMGKQVSYGIAEELLRLSVAMGEEGERPVNWLDNCGTRTEKDMRFSTSYNPQIFAILAERLLKSEGVHIIYGSQAAAVKMNDSKIEYIITEGKSGREAYKVRSVVDATGDCDIAKFSDAPTKVFKQGNILAAWYYVLDKDGYRLNPMGCSDIPDEEKTESNKVEMIADRRFSGLETEELSEMVCMTHDSIYNDLVKKRKNDDSTIPVTIPTVPQIRMTRKIEGEYELSSKEMHKYFETSIGMVSDWKKRGPVYEVPFETLYNGKVKNLICAGRCTSVDETLWDIMRVIPCCAVTGEAAGVAAAMSDDFTALDVKQLQEKLRNAGVVLHESDI